MSRFIQSLESRTLFSASFTDDQLHILTDTAAVKGALKSAGSIMMADMKIIAADVKAVTTSANKASNAALLKTMKADVTQVLALLRADSAALLASAGLAKRTAAEGQSLTLNPINPTVRARLAADSAVLQPLVDGAAAKLQLDLDSIELKTDVENIVAANPSSTTLPTDAATAQVNSTNALATFETAAATYQTDVDGLITDLDSIPTVPNLVGTYVGTAKATSGNHVGRIMGLTVQFTSEGDGRRPLRRRRHAGGPCDRDEDHRHLRGHRRRRRLQLLTLGVRPAVPPTATQLSTTTSPRTSAGARGFPAFPDCGYDGS
jgi:hypothetical protein